MPKLPTYTAPAGETPVFGGRRASAEDFDRGSGLTAAGHALSRAASGLMTEFEEQEARKALVGSTQIRADYNRRLDEAALSGEDPDKIKQDMMNDLSKIGEGFQTKRGADTLNVETAKNEISFDNEASRMKVERAAAEAKLATHNFLNSAGQNLQRDPTRLAQEEAAADALASTFRTSKEKQALIADGLKQDLNAAAVAQLVRTQPAETKKLLEQGKFKLTLEQREKGIRNADSYIKAQKEVEEHEKARLEKERAAREESAKLDLTRRIFSGETGANIYKEIVTNPNLDTNGTTQMMSILKQHRKDMQGGEGTAKTNPRVFNELRELVDLPASDPRRPTDASVLWKAYGKGLSKTDTEDLEKRLLANRTAEGEKWSKAEAEVIRNLRPQLDKSTMLNIDAEGGARVKEFTQFLRDKANQYRKEKKDPSSLLNPNAPDYIGKMVPAFQSGAQRRGAGIAKQMNTALDPKDEKARRPGETPAQYLQRIGK